MDVKNSTEYTQDQVLTQAYAQVT